MRCGILIIGSLLWDNGRRDAWRKARLDLNAQMHVTAPFRYGRKSESRGQTYTMTFEAGAARSQGVLVPCAAHAETIEHLTAEAVALWQAEDKKALPNSIRKNWGHVGALFSPAQAESPLASAWADYFRRTGRSRIAIIDDNGRLNIPWPNILTGQPVDLDVILATATNPDAPRPSAQEVADAWLAQSKGEEKYFFRNVRHGIRTPDDGAIWRRMEEPIRAWQIAQEAHREAIGTLRSEAQGEKSAGRIAPASAGKRSD